MNTTRINSIIRKGKIMKLNLVCAVVLLMGIKLASAEVYLVDTPNYQEVYGEYTLKDNLFGTVVTTEEVPPNAGFVDISSILDSYDFFDGVQQFTEMNSEPLSIQLSVDGNGDLIGAAITFWKTPIPTTNNEPVEGMDIYISPLYWQVNGFKDGECYEYLGPGGQCSAAFFGGTNSGVYYYFDQIFIDGFNF